MYDVILADPPWSFNVWSKDTGHGRSAESHYPTMSIDDLCAIPVDSIANKNCALFMWCVWPSIDQAFKVINAWGFEYKTKAFTWVKSNKSGFGFATGMGYYTRANDEPCLLGIRGNMPVATHDVLSIIYSPRREHSRKPDEQYSKIERLYPGKKYIELFARRTRPGWDVFGNEVKSDIELC